ncbi:MAG: recombinase, partial [Bacteroidetes bacterium]|nr:recombinase [Bacteroidota bacterium]
MDFIDKIYKEIGQNDANQTVKDFLSTGLMPLNYALSNRFHIGGFPVGRITEVYGGASSGKTLLATMAMKEAQKRDGLAVMLDFEHAFSMERALALGLSGDKDKWIYKQPATAEEGFGIIEFIMKVVREKYPEKYVCIIVDSVASMPTKLEQEAGFDGSNMKTKLSLAACLSANLKLLTPIISKTNVTMIFLNQTRENPGVMFGDKVTTAGGNALKFYASVRIKLSKNGKILDDDKEVIGEGVTAQTVKNKVASPFKSVPYIGDFEIGIDLIASHIEDLKKKGVFGDTKGWLEFEGKKYRQKDFVQILKKDEKL